MQNSINQMFIYFWYIVYFWHYIIQILSVFVSSEYLVNNN